MTPNHLSISTTFAAAVAQTPVQTPVQTPAQVPSASEPAPYVPGAPPAGPASQTGTAATQGQPLGPSGTPPPQSSPGGAGNYQFLFILMAVFVLFMIMSSRGGRKEKKAREAMLAGLARNDRVQTLGGIIGTIAEVRDQEVVLRVDEASNTRIRFARSAVQQVLQPARDRNKEVNGEIEGKPAGQRTSV